MKNSAILAGVLITLGWFTKVVPTSAMLSFDSNSKRNCLPGNYGDRCQHTCQYPKFGLQCTGTCNCKQTLCHHKNGCPPLAAVCPAGLTGKYCNERCKKPMYGYGCQQQCLCPKVRCSIVNGCQNIKPDIIRPNLKTKSSSVPKEKTTITGITNIQSEPSVKNDSMIYEGFTLEIQRKSQRNNGSIKDETASELIENTIFTQPSQTSNITWIHTSIISVGGMLAVIVIAHVIVSIINCVNVNRGPRHR